MVIKIEGYRQTWLREFPPDAIITSDQGRAQLVNLSEPDQSPDICVQYMADIGKTTKDAQEWVYSVEDTVINKVLVVPSLEGVGFDHAASYPAYRVRVDVPDDVMSTWVAILATRTRTYIMNEAGQTVEKISY